MVYSTQSALRITAAFRTVELTAVYKDVFLVFGFITSDPSYTGLAFNHKTRGKNLHVEKPLASSS